MGAIRVMALPNRAEILFCVAAVTPGSQGRPNLYGAIRDRAPHSCHGLRSHSMKRLPHPNMISSEDWQKRMRKMELSRSDLDSLVMNYLLVEGYGDAAERFAEECGLQPCMDLHSVRERMAIRAAIHLGEIEEAIEKTNVIKPEVPTILGSNTDLLFLLKQQIFIEKIRKSQISEALAFAQQELAPLVEANVSPRLLEQLGQTMSLLIFDEGSSAPVAELLDLAQRQRTASELNSAILTTQGLDHNPRLSAIIKMLLWCEAQLDRRRVVYPKLCDIAAGRLSSDPNFP
ncbi:uncharacterized protein VTP21DRAFT_2024 [Calcarisporiella thermophila]|uniref:uncharacterized protein n=1 Tax=Calcarisporiella thermophila TaxID=911321 RepID=UPI003742664C